MTVAGGAVDYQSAYIDLSHAAMETPASNVTLSLLDEADTTMTDLSGGLPMNGTYPLRDVSSITTAYWHHTATSDHAAWRDIASGHVDRRGWAGIGYHMGIDKDGRIAILNPLERRSNHTAGHNSRGVGIVLLGNYDEAIPSAAMQQGIERVDGYLDARGIRVHRLHRDVKATACPGKYAVLYLKKHTENRTDHGS